MRLNRLPLIAAVLSMAASPVAAEAAPDTKRPSVPTGLQALEVRETSVRVAWQAARDNVGVTRYELYRGSAKVADVSGTSHTVGGLSPKIRYRFRIRAVDAAGNRSGLSGWLSVRTRRRHLHRPGAWSSRPTTT